MNKKSLRVLEYNKILDMLASFAASDLAKEKLILLEPMTDTVEIRRRLTEVTSAVKLIEEKGNPPLGNIYDISYIGITRKGGSLTMANLLQVAYNIDIATAMKKYLMGSDLFAYEEVLEEHVHLASEIKRCIISEDEMADNASSDLRSIRREMSRIKDRVKNRLESIVGSDAYKGILQDAIVTIRDGRYVIPVKQEYRSSFPGMIHDHSSSGATLFIEPQAVVDLNNQLKELLADEKREIERILRELSDRVSENYHGLINNLRLLTELDQIFAKARFSVSYDGSCPEISEERMLVINGGRHPLIDPEKVVPVDIELGRDFTTLVITGPNTGGKTVTLKTTGLLSAMALSGLHIPAASGSVIPVFKEIFADIGDEQSIEQSLSTFSSHMKNIVDITEKADDDTLVLLDELGAGTDPTEGAALAIAVIEHLMDRGASVMATTHYTELKKYAVSKEGVENASMEFDIGTLTPTFRFSIGVPGRSNAFDISKKLGLDDGIINKSKELLERGDIEFEEVLSALEEDRKAAEEERRTAVVLAVAARKQKEELDRKEKEIANKREDIVRKAREEAREIVREARAATNEIQKEISRNRDMETLNRGRKKLRALEEKNIVSVKKENDAPVSPEDLKKGDTVRVVSLNKTGTVADTPDSRGNCYINVGSLKVRVNVKDLAYSDKKEEKKPDRTYNQALYTKRNDISISKSVIGENLDDARFIVSKYLDDAFMAGLKEVTVIHGRGEGILRDGLRKMLKTHKHARSFRPGAYNEGGDGVTVVELE